MQTLVRTVKQSEAMVCVRRGCDTIYSGTKACPNCGWEGATYRSIEELAMSNVLADPLIDQPMKTTRIQ